MSASNLCAISMTCFFYMIQRSDHAATASNSIWALTHGEIMWEEDRGDTTLITLKKNRRVIYTATGGISGISLETAWRSSLSGTRRFGFMILSRAVIAHLGPGICQ